LGGFRIRLILLEGGERLPLLVDQDGFPMFRPAVWMMTMRRAINLATATLKEDLQALKVLYSWGFLAGVDIEDRLLAGRFLSAAECGSLADALRRPISELDSAGERDKQVEPIRTRALESHRMRQRVGGGEIGTPTTATRMRTVVQYLKWLADEGRNGLALKDAEARGMGRDEMLANLVSRIPKGGSRNTLGKREAPPPAVVDSLLRVIELDAPENPWSDLGLRVRNRLLIYLLWALHLTGVGVDCWHGWPPSPRRHPLPQVPG